MSNKSRRLLLCWKNILKEFYLLNNINICNDNITNQNKMITTIFKNHKLQNSIIRNTHSFKKIKKQLINKIKNIDNRQLLIEFDKNIDNIIKRDDFKNNNLKMNFGISFPDRDHGVDNLRRIECNSDSVINISGSIDKNQITKIIFDYICENPNDNNTQIQEHVDKVVHKSIDDSMSTISFTEMNNKYNEINVLFILILQKKI